MDARPVMTLAEFRWLLGCAGGTVVLRWMFGADSWLAGEALAVGAGFPWAWRWVIRRGYR